MKHLLLFALIQVSTITLQANTSTPIHKEIIMGHLSVLSDKNSIPLTQQVTAPNGTHYMTGEHKESLGGGNYSTDSASLPMNNITPLYGSSDRFLIPYTVSGGGSGIFWVLGLFQADFVHHKVVCLDTMMLGDRVQEIVVHSESKGSWVTYRDYTSEENFGDKPTKNVKKILTFDASLQHITTPHAASLSSFYEKALKPYAYPDNNKYELPPFYAEGFYPLGYSKDGEHFAYMTQCAANEAGIITLEIIVQDLVSDKILWKHSAHSGENPPDNITFEYYWLQDNASVVAKLQTLGIVLDNHLRAKEIPISHKGDTLSFHTTSRKKPDFKAYQPTIREVSINVTSKKHGSKNIYHYTNKEEYSFILDTQPIGYFTMADTKERVALIVADLYRGYEGPPHEVRYKIVGVSLTKGFKK